MAVLVVLMESAKPGILLLVAVYARYQLQGD